jgi:hypothetical protein
MKTVGRVYCSVVDYRSIWKPKQIAALSVQARLCRDVVLLRLFPSIRNGEIKTFGHLHFLVYYGIRNRYVKNRPIENMDSDPDFSLKYSAPYFVFC